jgi:hypothetical protein
MPVGRGSLPLASHRDGWLEPSAKNRARGIVFPLPRDVLTSLEEAPEVFDNLVVRAPRKRSGHREIPLGHFHDTVDLDTNTRRFQPGNASRRVFRNKRSRMRFATRLPTSTGMFRRAPLSAPVGALTVPSPRRL